MTDTDYDDTLGWADECLLDLQQVADTLPLGYLQDYAAANGFSQEIRDGLDKLMAAACVLTYDGPDVIDAFAKAAGMYDELMRRERERKEQERAREADPNSMINQLRRKYQGAGQS
jgi:hypothetical protein